MERSLRHRSLIRRGLLAGAVLFLCVLAWKALSGAFRQMPRSHTVGQKIETGVQIGCGVLSLLAVLTRFWNRRWAAQVQTAWSVSLASAAGLSSLVWGPPMPFVGALFVVLALLLARATQRALQTFPRSTRCGRDQIYDGQFRPVIKQTIKRLRGW